MLGLAIDIKSLPLPPLLREKEEEKTQMRRML